MNLNMYQIIIMYIINTYVGKFWSFPLILTSLFDYKLNVIRDKERVNNLLKEFESKTYYSYNDENRKPLGWILSFTRFYIGLIENVPLLRGGEVKWIWLFCSNNFIENIKSYNIKKSSIKEKNNLVKFIKGYGNYHNWNYRIRNLPLEIDSHDYQDKIINEMWEIYKKQGYLTSYLYGKVGAGKTCIGHLLAKKKKSQIYNNFNPTQPGETLDNLYSYSDKSLNSPLVIIIDEFDMILKKITNSEIIPHEHVPIFIDSKQSWNNFLDSIERGQYPNLILILISNSGPDEINKLDPCYVREGRVHYVREVVKNIKL